MDQTLSYSIIIPAKDEAETLPQLFQEVYQVMEGLDMPWELICVDDGSSDNTYAVLLEAHTRYHPHLRIIQLDQSYGQSTALYAAFQQARGVWVITLDGDGQNNPADLPRLIALQGYADLICGRRVARQDRWYRRLVSQVANRIRRALLQDGVDDTGCSLKLMKRSILLTLPWFHGAHRFLPALYTLAGARVVQTQVSHRPRLAGQTHYRFWNRGLIPLIDLLGVLWLRSRRIHYRIKQQDSVLE